RDLGIREGGLLLHDGRRDSGIGQVHERAGAHARERGRGGLGGGSGRDRGRRRGRGRGLGLGEARRLLARLLGVSGLVRLAPLLGQASLLCLLLLCEAAHLLLLPLLLLLLRLAARVVLGAGYRDVVHRLSAGGGLGLDLLLRVLRGLELGFRLLLL